MLKLVITSIRSSILNNSKYLEGFNEEETADYNVYHFNYSYVTIDATFRRIFTSQNRYIGEGHYEEATLGLKIRHSLHSARIIG